MAETMTTRSLIESFGYVYTGNCAPCQGKFMVFKNDRFPGVEVRLKTADPNFAQIKRNGNIIATAGVSNIEEKLKQNNLL